MKKNETLRIIGAAVLLFAAAGLLHAHRRSEVVPHPERLDHVSRHILNYTATDIPIREDIREVLGPGDFLERMYEAPGQPALDLFIAYFPSQKTGDTIHSPKNCLPGAGWTPTESRTIHMRSPNGSIPANLYVVSQGGERQLVLYWYQAHGRAVASEYWAKFYLVADSIRMNRTDGALVRVTTVIMPREAVASAEARAVGFAQQLMPELPRFIPN